MVVGRPPEIKAAVATVPKPVVASGTNTISKVPAFDWVYGCSPTSAAMLFGYYDNVGYENMYTGPANGGVVPMTNSIWKTVESPLIGESPLSATHLGIDGRTTKGHVDDYYIEYNNADPDPYIVNGWIAHTPDDSAGDFMGTSQSSFGNIDGGTTFFYKPDGSPLDDYTGEEPHSRDGAHGLRLFAESRGYNVVRNFSQYIKVHDSDPGLGFTFSDFQAEIDAGRPVLIQLDGHTMVGYGYNTAGSIVYVHDTWDYKEHQMTWGGEYSNMQHIGVTVFELESLSKPSVTITANDLAIYDGDAGVDKFTITATFSETMNSAYIPAVTFSPLLTTTLTNKRGAWSPGNTVYTWTFNIEDVGVKIDDVDVAVDGGRDMDNNTQIPETNTDYIDVDTHNPTVTLIASDTAIYDGDKGAEKFTLTAIFSETMDSAYTPAVAFSPVLTSTLTNQGGDWNTSNTVYTWTFDVKDASLKLDNVDVTVDGGRDSAGNAQTPKTNTDYIDIDTQNPSVTVTASDMAIYDGDAGVDKFTLTATFSESMDSTQIPTVAFSPLLTTTLTNQIGAWNLSNTVYTWTFDIEDAGLKMDDVDVTVDGSRDFAGNSQIPKTNVDYINVDTQNPSVTITDGDLAIYDGDTSFDKFTLTATFSETMNSSYIPTVAFSPLLNTTLTNQSGDWSPSNTTYIWTFDIEDAGLKMDDVDVTVDGGRDFAGNTQNPKTNTDYIDVDTQNPSVTITAGDLAIYDSDTGVDKFAVTATFSESMDSTQIPTVVFSPVLTTTLTNQIGAWNLSNTVYTWTFDVGDANVRVDNVDVTVDSGRDFAGNTQTPKTNTDYIHVDTQNPSVTVAVNDMAIYDGDVDVDRFTLTAIFSETMDNTRIPTVTFSPVLTTTLTNKSGDWSPGNTVYTWTFDIEDSGVKIDDVDVTVDDGRNLAGNAQIPKTNTDYIDVDTQNPAVAIEDIPEIISEIVTVSGTASDTLPDDLVKVQVMLKNSIDIKYWDGNSWVFQETWLDATGITSWTYSMPDLKDGKSYEIKAKSIDKAGNESLLLSDSFTFEPEKGGLFDCICGSTKAKASSAELIIGWGLLGLFWGGGYHLVRRISKRRK